jgi:hypothetical protein
MAKSNLRIAIVFAADPKELAATQVETTRLSKVAHALSSAGAQVISAPFCDAIANEIEARLSTVDLVLAWFNPFEAGTDRSRLNAMLRSLASQGVLVSTHPDVIDKMGTKDVLYQTRHMPWGVDIKRYGSADAMQAELPDSLRQGPRVLKQMRGQSGDGIWKISLKEDSSRPLVAVRHAKRGSPEELILLEEFVALCRPYFLHSGAMIDQAYQSRLHEGMIRCYVVHNKVQGFGEQLINALYPAPTGRPESDAPQPGPRLYYPADRPDFQDLKRRLEGDWIPQMCDILKLQPDDLPVLWDADFMLGEKALNEKAFNGKDCYVLCEINVSSVYPFPPSALGPLVNEALRRCDARPNFRLKGASGRAQH